MSHEDLSNYMSGRYYISPSTLYSIATLSPNKEAYEVPVEGDWVIIAVIVHREDVRVSNPSSRNDDDGPEHAPPKASKFIKFRLVDFGTPTADKSGATRGDAMLNMLFFEASSVSEIKEEESKSRGKKVYKGGSGGAFEASAKYREGAVIAVLNPVVLRPFQVGHSRLILYALSKLIIFRAPKAHPILPGTFSRLNLVVLTVFKLLDNRKILVCVQLPNEMVHHAEVGTTGVPRTFVNTIFKPLSRVVEQQDLSSPLRMFLGRTSYLDFSSTSRTSGMQTSAAPFRKGANKSTFDPIQKHGLLPASGSQLAPRDAGATYIVGGYVLDTTTKHDPSDRYVHEHMGREKEARRKRQIEGKRADKRLLEHLMGQETALTTGAQALRMAQEQLVAGKNKTGEKGEGVVKEKTKKSAFSASTVQRIGFDPTLKGGVEKKPRQEAQRKVSIYSSHECEFRPTNR